MMQSKMRWWGLTGGIATGKSSVAARLRASGVPVVDADIIAREVVARGTPGLRKIVEVFGRSVVQEDGNLDRAKMATDIFSDLEKRRRLEAIVHPLVQQRFRELRAQLEAQNVPLAFYDVPLLYEKDLADQFEGVVVVACSAQKQLERLMARNGLSKSEAAARIGSQMSLMDKAAQANHVIWNDGTLADLDAEVVRLLEKLQPKP